MRALIFLAIALCAACATTNVEQAVAAGKPLAISLTPSAQSVTEGQSATLTLNKSGGNGRTSAVRITTSDGSFSASVVPGSQFSVPTVDDSVVNGTRSVTVTGTASTGATARATITVLDNDVAPPPPTPTPTPTPAPTGNWVSAPVAAGNYACHLISTQGLNSHPCGQGLVYRILYAVQSADAVPVTLYAAQAYSDASGEFPLNDAYATGFVGFFQASDLGGLAPAPALPTLMRGQRG